LDDRGKITSMHEMKTALTSRKTERATVLVAGIGDLE
jgi:hypothetical protein